MMDKMLGAVAAYNMLAAGDTVVVAVSGGADSVSLLHLLHRAAGELGITLRACHLNHGIRGAESDADAAFVRALCQRLEIPLEELAVEHLVEDAKIKGKTLEEYARECRYAFFAACATRYHAKIATAHTLSDSLETTLFHLARGTGLRGLRGIPPVRGNIIRPIITCTRAEVEEYCRENELAYVTDSTNLCDAYSRNRIRHQVIPQLRQVHSGLESSYARMVQSLAQDEDFLTQQAQQALQEVRTEGGCSTAALAGLHPALSYRVLMLVAAQNGYSCESRQAQLLLQNLRTPHFALELTKGRFAEISGGNLRFCEIPTATPYFELPVREGTFCVNNTRMVTFTLTNYEHYKQIEKYDEKVLKNGLDCGRINGKLFLRQKQNGDCIRLAHRGVSKTLKKLFCEEKLSQTARQNIPVLADDTGVVWVSGFGCDARVAVNEDTKKIWIISIAEE